MLKYIGLFLTMALFFHCSDGIDKTLPKVNNPTEMNKTFLALGDSYTIGEGVPEEGRWYKQLIHLIEQEENFSIQSDVIAKTGWTTAELSNAIKASQNTEKYSMVTLLIGVNNQYRGQSLDTYQKEFKELLETATSYADGKKENVIVLSIPDWGITPFGKANSDPEKVKTQIDAFNAVAKKECSENGIVFINITEISRKAENEVEFIAEDKLHFSGNMYELWAKETLPFAKQILNK